MSEKKQFQKGTIIIGAAGSGKTKLAKEMAKKYNDNETCFISARSNGIFENPFFFNGCTRETKLVILDNVNTVDKCLFMYCYIPGPLTVDKQSQPAFEITPRIIIVCHESINESDFPKEYSFQRRFDVINLSKTN